jgi:hypothetical protein
VPQRIQLRRTKGWRMPPNTVKVDRSTKWGNPWRVVPGLLEAAEAVRRFRSDLTNPATLKRIQYRAIVRSDLFRGGEAAYLRMKLDMHELRGKNLACWCPPDQPCHADVLLEVANRE